MNIVADASVDKGIVDRLRSDGHEVIYIAEEQEKDRLERQAEKIAPFQDTKVLEKANDKKYNLLAEDKDFGELVHRARLAAPSGITLYRLDGFTEEQKARRISEFYQKYDNQLENKFAVVEHATERIRELDLEQQQSPSR